MASQTVVPFGFGVGDVLDLAELAIGVYHQVRSSIPEYHQLAAQTKQLSDLLESLAALATNLKLSDEQWIQIAEWNTIARELLIEMKSKLDEYQSLGANESKFQKLTWKKTILPDFRARLTAQVTMLQALYFSLSQSKVLVNQSEMLKALQVLTTKMKSGCTRVLSVCSLSQESQHEADESNVEWAAITGELELLGITASLANAHKDLIVRYFEVAIACGELPGGAYSDCESDVDGAANAKAAESGKVEAWLEFDPLLQKSNEVEHYDESKTLDDGVNLIIREGDILVPAFDHSQKRNISQDDEKLCQYYASSGLEMGLSRPTLQQVSIPQNSSTTRRQYEGSINITFKFEGCGDPDYFVGLIQDRLTHELEASHHAFFVDISSTHRIHRLKRLMYLTTMIEERILGSRPVTAARYVLDALQARNSTNTKKLAHQAQISAHRMAAMTERMHAIATKTKIETVSMRIITWVTLLFLPGTFISTLLSTPMLEFKLGESRPSLHGISLGGLNLYLLMSLPVTLITLVGWLAMTRFEGRWEKKIDEEAIAFKAGNDLSEFGDSERTCDISKRKREASVSLVLMAIGSIFLLFVIWWFK